MNKSIYAHVSNMFGFLNYAKRECNDIIESDIKECIRKIVLTHFTDEAGMINPTIQMIEEYEKENIHIIVKMIGIERHKMCDLNAYYKYEEPGIEYIIRYEDGINPDIEITLNPGGEIL